MRRRACSRSGKRQRLCARSATAIPALSPAKGSSSCRQENKMNTGQSKLRLMIGAGLTAFVWVLYFVRIFLGVGPMHDHQGNQSPAAHYLMGALVVTAMVVTWIVVRGR